MLALTFSEAEGVRLERRRAVPTPPPGEALVRVRRAGVCATDLELVRGYLPGFAAVLGHEFVGVVERLGSGAGAALLNARVVGEINCRDPGCPCGDPDPVFVRNHAPGRTVLGLIGRDGAMAQYLTLPVENLHAVPDAVPDELACFAEPLAAACRVVEQGVPRAGGAVAVVGDGKLGLLVAAALAAAGARVTLLGRHAAKVALARGVVADARVLDAADATAASLGLAEAFDAVVEATGSSGGVRLALGLARPLGTVVLKSTCAVAGPSVAAAPRWGEVANDVVVRELTVRGSRCGPIPEALRLLAGDANVRRLCAAMVHAVVPLAEAPRALELAATRGVLKVQIDCT